MSVNKKLPIIFVIALIAVTAGCLDYGDIGAVIDSWNEITDKENQFVSAIDDIALDYDYIDFDNPAQTQRDVQKINVKLIKIQQILDEESLLISEFAGSTVAVTDDANKYANEALNYIRESHKYKVKAVSSIQDMNLILSDMIDMLATMDEMNIYEMEELIEKLEKLEMKVEIIESEGDVNSEKADEYYNKAYDSIKKLEALQ